MNITENTLIPEVLEAHPGARPVFDQYGLRGCGGPLGPAETLRFFSRAHGVDLDRLIKELNETIIEGPVEEKRVEAKPAALEDRIYRRFFVTAIAATLTAGATWGAYLLWRIATNKSFTSLSVHEVNAHGHAQIFGWVALFVMGFAYQAFPRFKHGSLWRPDLANLSFILMVSGILLSVAGGIFWRQPLALVVGDAGAAAELAAVAIFIVVMAKTLNISLPRSEPYELYIGAALLWLLVATVFSGVHFHMTMAAATQEALLRQVATWQAPLRDIQIYGFAMLMILGVSQRFLPGMYLFPATPARKSKTALLLLNAAIAGEVTSFVVFMRTGWAPAAFALEGMAALLLGTVLWLALPWRLWSPTAESDRGLKFIRAAYLWLAISLVLVVLMPFYNIAKGVAFSHAYFGAARHAITVGFITMMILGVASKVVPTLGGLNARRLSSLLPVFLLINIGCATRVIFQILTDSFPWAFRVAGVSGLFEVAALTIWGVHMIGVMNRAARIETGLERPPSATLKPGAVGADAIVADVLEAVPGSLDVFISAGFTTLKNPVARRTLARAITVGAACRRIGIAADEFLEELNRRETHGDEIKKQEKEGALI